MIPGFAWLTTGRISYLWIAPQAWYLSAPQSLGVYDLAPGFARVTTGRVSCLWISSQTAGGKLGLKGLKCVEGR